MSDLFDNIKKNIITNMTPLQNAFKKQANLFIDTFLEDENTGDDEYSDNFEDTSDKSDNNDDNDNNTDNNNTNIIKNQICSAPTQQIFKDNFKNLKINVYSPIICEDQLIENVEEHNDGIINNTEETKNIKIDKSVKKFTFEDTKEKIDNLCNDIINSDCVTHNYIYNDKLLIYNLLTLTKIEKNQKLSISFDNTSDNKLNFQIDIDESYFPQLSRRYYNQNRYCTTNSIRCLIDYAVEQHDYYKSIENNEYIQKYTELLDKTKCGLLNLKFTYENDNEITDKINNIIDKITTFNNSKNIVNNKIN